MSRVWYVTFGHGQQHPITGQDLFGAYCRVEADTYEEVHGRMIQSIFGRQWAFIYPEADGPRGAGVDRFGLWEIKLPELSPMAPIVWGAWAALGEGERLRLDRFVDLIAQPIEVAWYRHHHDENMRRLRKLADRMDRPSLTCEINEPPAEFTEAMQSALRRLAQETQLPEHLVQPPKPEPPFERLDGGGS